MKSNLLQRVNEGKEKPGSLKGPAVAFYLISLVVAFIAGGYYERAKAPVIQARAPMENVTEAVTAPPEQTPAPLATAEPAPTTHFTPPALITSEPAATPMRVEKAIAVAPAATASKAPAIAVAAPSVAATPAATPAKQAGAVTVTEAVTDIPVKRDGKITGYINLQPGQQIVPVAVENGQIKVKSGDNFVYVPVKSTDLVAH